LSVQLDRVCGKCGSEVKQTVTFTEEDGKIKIGAWVGWCPYCAGFLLKPTPGEVKRALVLKEKKG